MFPRIVCLLATAALAGGADAQQYRWVDGKGGVHYTDTPPPPSATDVKKKNLKPNMVGQQGSYALAEAVKNSPVTLYTHPICTEACELARDLLRKRGVPFREVSAVDEARAEELRQVSGGDQVPMLVVGSIVEKTPSEEAYNRALDVAHYPRTPSGPAPASAR